MRILRLITVVFLAGCLATPCFGYVSTTKEKYKNLALILDDMKARYPGFVGFAGTYDQLQVMGLDEPTAQMELDAADISNLKQNDKRRKQLKQTRNKLKGLGLDNKDLEIMGLSNDIDD